MFWPWSKTVDLQKTGLAFCWMVTVCATPFCWTIYAFMLLYRVVVTGLFGRKYTFLTGMDAIIGQELHSPNCMINAALFLEGRNINAADNFERFWSEVVVATKEDSLPEKFTNRKRKRFPNFSRCLSFRYGFLAWHDVDWSTMNSAEHLFEHPGGTVGSEEELQLVINYYCNRVLPSSRPPWELVLIRLRDGWRPPRYVGETVPDAVWLWRVNHSIVDGVSLIRIMSEVLATNREVAKGALLRTVGTLPEWARQPVSTWKRVRLWLDGLLHVIFFFLKNIFERDRGFLLDRDVTHRKNYVWSSPITMTRVRTVKKLASAGEGAGFTFNDVVMSCVAGALGRFVGSQFAGKVPDRLRAYVPVSHQALDGPVTDGNQFVCPPVKLSTGETDQRRRLVATQAAASEMKSSIQSGFHRFAIRMAGRLFTRRIAPLCLVPMTPCVTFSNMAGPPQRLELVGCRMIDCFIFSPNSFVTGIALSITSYCDSFVIAVTMDTGIGKQVEVAKSLVKMVEEELELLEQIHVLPSGSYRARYEKSVAVLDRVVVIEPVHAASYKLISENRETFP